MEVVRAVVFDLDDTLYLERDYVASGFRAVSRDLANRSSVREEELFGFLWGRFQSGARGGHFDRMLEEYPELSLLAKTAELVSLYRSHPPSIVLLNGIAGILDGLKRTSVRMGIITDGPVLSQTSKMRALGLEDTIAHRIQTDAWGPAYRKPHCRAFVSIAAQLEVKPEECIYVGDNPEKDFRGAKALGWKTLRLRIPSQLHYALDARDSTYAPGAEVHSIAELAEFLRRCCGVECELRLSGKEDIHHEAFKRSRPWIVE